MRAEAPALYETAVTIAPAIAATKMPAKVRWLLIPAVYAAAATDGSVSEGQINRETEHLFHQGVGKVKGNGRLSELWNEDSEAGANAHAVLREPGVVVHGSAVNERHHGQEVTHDWDLVLGARKE
jgi:hypothetical protein